MGCFCQRRPAFSTSSADLGQRWHQFQWPMPIKCVVNGSSIFAQLVWARLPPALEARQSRNWRSPFLESRRVIAVVTNLTTGGITWWPAFTSLLIDGCITAGNDRTDTSVLGNPRRNTNCFFCNYLVSLRISGNRLACNWWCILTHSCKVYNLIHFKWIFHLLLAWFSIENLSRLTKVRS